MTAEKVQFEYEPAVRDLSPEERDEILAELQADGGRDPASASDDAP